MARTMHTSTPIRSPAPRRSVRVRRTVAPGPFASPPRDAPAVLAAVTPSHPSPMRYRQTTGGMVLRPRPFSTASGSTTGGSRSAATNRRGNSATPLRPRQNAQVTRRRLSPEIRENGQNNVNPIYNGDAEGAALLAEGHQVRHAAIEAINRVRQDHVTVEERKRRTMESWILRMSRPRRSEDSKCLPLSPCTICMEDDPLKPVGCTSCNQMIGCLLCVANWFTSTGQYRSGCPLCRFKWTRNEPAVFSVIVEKPKKKKK